MEFNPNSMNRRDFLIHSMAGTAGMTLISPILSGCSVLHDPLHDFGIITNVVQNQIKADHRRTMSLLAEMGYKYLEFGGVFGEKPAELKQFMEGIGLAPLAGGTSISGLLGDGLQKSIDDCLEMGKKYLVCYWPWMDGGEHPTMDQVKFAVDAFMKMGETCNNNGLRFAFHNHEKEFKELDGQVIYDYILEETDPELVTMELDLYWAHKGGRDIREYFKRYPGRFELVHVKDSFQSESMESFACAGSGIIDFPDLFSYRELAGFKHLLVEHDRPPPENEIECAHSSIKYLKSLKF
jgi:sugar phosphate isomerase/epimerase